MACTNNKKLFDNENLLSYNIMITWYSLKSIYMYMHIVYMYMYRHVPIIV